MYSPHFAFGQGRIHSERPWKREKRGTGNEANLGPVPEAPSPPPTILEGHLRQTDQAPSAQPLESHSLALPPPLSLHRGACPTPPLRWYTPYLPPLRDH